MQSSLASAALAMPSIRGSTPKRRPNVLFIAVDDMNVDGAIYGGPVCTPNLARLAAQGMRFDGAFCQYPWCSPSRSSLLTGLRPDQTRVFDLQYHFRTGLPDIVTLPQLFIQNGYYVARVGKIYHAGNPGQIGTSGLDDPVSWHEVFNPAGRDKIELLSHLINYTPHKAGLGSAIAWYADAAGRDEDYTDGMVATEAIRLLGLHRHEPFFLGVGFYKPHCPYIAPQTYFDLYPPDSIPLPVVPADYRAAVPRGALESTNPWPNFGVAIEDARAAKRAYYAGYSFVDAQIGRVLDALDRLGLRDNTIVVFWSDHGYHLGEHGLWFKESCFEEAARVPLIISPPGFRRAGQGCGRLVEHVDLYPTVADLAGLVTPRGLAGVSLRPLLENPRLPWNRPAFTQVQRHGNNGYAGHSIRTERWRYTEWDDGRKGRELYDHAQDPRETNNLVRDSRYASVLGELQPRVKQNWPTRVTGGTVASRKENVTPLNSTSP